MLNKPLIRLRGGVSVSDVADASREALRGFMMLRSDKRALAEWLVGPYESAVGFARGTASPSKDLGPPTTIAELVARTKSGLSRAIYASTSPGAEDLIRALPAVVHVRPVVDEWGGRGFAPFHVQDIPLIDRGLSLLMADYLTRADDFLEEMPSWLDSVEGRSRKSGFITRVDVVPLPKTNV